MGTTGLVPLLRRDGSGPATTVIVVAPIRVHRESLAATLEDHANRYVVGKAATLDEGLGRLRDLQGPAVVLLDGTLLSELRLNMPLAGEPEPKLLAVGVPEDKAVAWIEAEHSGALPQTGRSMTSSWRSSASRGTSSSRRPR